MPAVTTWRSVTPFIYRLFHEQPSEQIQLSVLNHVHALCSYLGREAGEMVEGTAYMQIDISWSPSTVDHRKNLI